MFNTKVFCSCGREVVVRFYSGIAKNGTRMCEVCLEKVFGSIQETEPKHNNDLEEEEC